MHCYQFIPLFIQMVKYNINTHFPSFKHLLLQNDGDLVVSQQVKVKPSLKHYDKDVLNQIIPIEACGVLLESPRNFSTLVRIMLFTTTY